MMAAIVLCDLDDTLFSTRRKCPTDVRSEDLTLSAWGSDGAPISYATPAQFRLTKWLENTAVMVPVTARSTEALLRTSIAFDFAISAHGGVVLMRDTASGERQVSPEWHGRMAAALLPCRAMLGDIVESVERDAQQHGVSVRSRIVAEAGLPLYVVVKHGLTDGNDPELQRACADTTARLPPGWTAHVNGNNVAYLPPGLGKAHAAAWLLPQLRALYPDRPAIGIGDSFTDAGFMQLCDFAMAPTGSQLASKLFA